MSNVITILVPFPGEFAVELMVVVHHPALLTSCYETGKLMQDCHYTIHVLCSLHLFLKTMPSCHSITMLSGIIHVGKTLVPECVT